MSWFTRITRPSTDESAPKVRRTRFAEAQAQFGGAADILDVAFDAAPNSDVGQTVCTVHRSDVGAGAAGTCYESWTSTAKPTN